MSIQQLAFELPNAASGPDTVTLDRLAADHDAVVLVFLRDHYCGKCRDQVQELAAHHDAFRERNAEIVAVLPEPLDTATDWQERFGLPYPLLADPAADVAQQYDQPTQFGVLGSLSDFVGRLPETVVLDTRAEPEVAFVHRGEEFGDRPTPGELLEILENRN